jgi:hypothetical protein
MALLFLVFLTSAVVSQTTMTFEKVSFGRRVNVTLKDKLEYCATSTVSRCNTTLKVVTNPSTQHLPLSVDSNAVMYVRYVYNDSTVEVPDGERPVNFTLSAMFYPKVDKYSFLTVPASTFTKFNISPPSVYKPNRSYIHKLPKTTCIC